MAKLQSWVKYPTNFGTTSVSPLVPKPPPRRARQRYQRRPGGGRKPLGDRQIILRHCLCAADWLPVKALPKSFGSASSVHKHFQRWRGQGFFLALWQAGLAEYDEMEGIAWEWQSIDGDARQSATGTGSGGQQPHRSGGKRQQAQPVGGRGWRPAVPIVSGANRHDVKLLAITLDGIVIVRPKTTRRRRQNLCADKGYAGGPAAQAMKRRGYTPHVRQRGEEALARRKGQRARRWVVERTHSWFNRFRKLLVRYEKTAANFTALLQCAAALICWRVLILT